MLATLAVYVVAVLLLCAGFYFARLAAAVRQIARVAAGAYATLRDGSLDDLAKEKAVQRSALEMVKQTVQLAVKLLVILLVTAFPVWLAVTLGWIGMDRFAQFALRIDVLLITTALMVAAVFTWRRKRKPGS